MIDFAPSKTWRCRAGRLAIFALLALLPCGCDDAPRQPALFVYCAAGMRKPMEALGEQYLRDQGVRIELQFAGSNTLLSQLRLSRKGDLLLAADATFIEAARKDGLVGDVVPVTRLMPVLVVNQSSPRRVKHLDDLLQDDVRVALAIPAAAAIGQTSKSVLQTAGIWEDVKEQVRQSGVFLPTVNEVASAVSLGSVDAGIVWDAVALQFDHLSVIHLRELDAAPAVVEIAVLTTSRQAEAAMKFSAFIAGGEGRRVFALHGYASPSTVDAEAGESNAARAQLSGVQGGTENGA